MGQPLPAPSLLGAAVISSPSISARVSSSSVTACGEGQEGKGVRPAQYGLHAVPPQDFSMPTAVRTVCRGGRRRCPWGQSVLLLLVPSPRMCMTPGRTAGGASSKGKTSNPEKSVWCWGWTQGLAHASGLSAVKTGNFKTNGIHKFTPLHFLFSKSRGEDNCM